MAHHYNRLEKSSLFFMPKIHMNSVVEQFVSSATPEKFSLFLSNLSFILCKFLSFISLKFQFDDNNNDEEESMSLFILLFKFISLNKNVTLSRLKDRITFIFIF